MFSKWLIHGLAIVIIAMWVTSCVLSFMRPTYSPPASIQWCISILAGAAFGKGVVEGMRPKNGNVGNGH